MINNPNEYVSLPDAIKMFSKSKETIRRYKREGKIKDTKLVNGRLYLNKRELHVLMLTMGRDRAEGQSNPASVADEVKVSNTHNEYSVSRQPSVYEVYEKFIEMLEGTIEKEEGRSNDLRSELKQVREQLHEAQLKIMALERQITGEPKALLEEDIPEPPPKEEYGSITGFGFRRSATKVFGKVLGL